MDRQKNLDDSELVALVECVGELLLWGGELLEQERLRTEQERERADQNEVQLQQERSFRRHLEERLKAMGVDDLSGG